MRIAPVLRISMLLFLIRNGQNLERVYGKRREKFLGKK